MITTFEALELPTRAPRVHVRQYAGNHEDPDGQVRERLAALAKPWPHCTYANPSVLITCTHPTEEFFLTIRRHQARWCRQARNTFGAAGRKSKTWISPEGRLSKRERFLQRARCYTGVLYIDGRLIQPHRWRQYEQS